MPRTAKIPALPADAVGFIAPRKDKQARLAVFFPCGTVSNTFGWDRAEVVAALASAGMTVDDANVIRRAA